MTAYSLAVQADVRKRMSPPNRQDVPQISKSLGIYRSTLYQWRSNWRLHGEVVPASEKDPESWSAADKFTMVLGTAGFNATELSSYCRERGLFAEQVDRWRQTAHVKKNQFTLYEHQLPIADQFIINGFCFGYRSVGSRI